MANERIIFRRGTSTTLPSEKVPGTILIETDTGRAYVDDTESSRIQIKDDTKMDKENPTGTGSFSLNRKADTTIGNYSFAEGNNTTASGDDSHAEGYKTAASGSSQHVQGKFNIDDTTGTYADIIGNGTSDTARSNAATVDWNGNAWYAGDVYVGSTSGTNKDAGSKKLATEEYVQSMISSGGVTVDVAMSDTSVHPVQNKVIKTYVDSLVIDDGSID